jgi:2-polyprenyl-6-methoxyphenol hydroxylase-like FAD-dependent oxidoreductase
MNTGHIPLYDVVQIGYGPVSEIMALALARQGRKVAVFERWKERFPLPRAVCIDHELYRVLSALGMSHDLPAVSHAGPQYRWFNAEWKELLAIDWSAESISGGPEVNFVHQPTLEKMFEEVVMACPNVDLRLGWEAVEATQTDDYAELVVRDVETGETRTVRGKYLIGADGANSLVRRAIGSTQEDRGFEADWLVIDVLPNVGVTLDIPPAAQYCNPERPTTIVPAGIKDGRYFRRWEFMRLPHETCEELEHEHVAWQLLAPWVKPEQATIVRHKVYTFRSLLANSWRKGRMLIAGDAAHVMPPFMGQGMCAGLRDDWNLAWKLGLVLDGRASDALLDTYQPERRPHVSDVIDLSMFLGKIICIPDAQKAAERDEAFFSGKVPPPPAFPCPRHPPSRASPTASCAAARTVRCRRRPGCSVRTARCVKVRAAGASTRSPASASCSYRVAPQRKRRWARASAPSSMRSARNASSSFPREPRVMRARSSISTPSSFPTCSSTASTRCSCVPISTFMAPSPGQARSMRS